MGTLANAFDELRLFGLDVLLIGMRRSPGQVLEAKYIIGEGLKRLASQHPPDRSGRREMVEGIVAAAAAEGYDPAEVQAYLDDSAGARAERLCDDLLAAGMYAGLDGLVAFVADALRVHPDDAREMVEAHRAAGFGRNELYESWTRLPSRNRRRSEEPRAHCDARRAEPSSACRPSREESAPHTSFAAPGPSYHGRRTTVGALRFPMTPRRRARRPRSVSCPVEVKPLCVRVHSG